MGAKVSLHANQNKCFTIFLTQVVVIFIYYLVIIREEQQQNPQNIYRFFGTWYQSAWYALWNFCMNTACSVMGNIA